MNPKGTPKNLKPFKKGAEWNGNAGGIRKGTRSITRTLRDALNRVSADNPDFSEVDAIVKAWLQSMKKGNVEALKVALDRLEGPVKQQHEVDLKGEVPSAESLMEILKKAQDLPLLNPES